MVQVWVRRKAGTMFGPCLWKRGVGSWLAQATGDGHFGGRLLLGSFGVAVPSAARWICLAVVREAQFCRAMPQCILMHARRTSAGCVVTLWKTYATMGHTDVSRRFFGGIAARGVLKQLNWRWIGSRPIWRPSGRRMSPVSARLRADAPCFLSHHRPFGPLAASVWFALAPSVWPCRESRGAAFVRGHAESEASHHMSPNTWLKVGDDEESHGRERQSV